MDKVDKVDKFAYILPMAETLASGNRGDRRVRRARRSRTVPNQRVSRLSQLFAQRAARLPVEGLRILEAALEDRHADARTIADAVVAASVGETSRDVVDLQGSGIGETIPLAKGRKQLDAISVDDETSDWSQTELVGVGDLADRFGFGRSTIDKWRRTHKALAFSHGVRNYVFPLAQFEGTRPIAGIDKVRAHFARDETAWEWLVTPNRDTGGKPPLDWLRAARIDEVAHAAEGAFDYA